MYSDEGKLVRDFLAGTGPGPRGRYLQDILAMSDDELAWSYEVIQWLFPLSERSSTLSPTLTRKDLALLGRNPEAARGAGQAWQRMLRFLGFEQRITAGGIAIVPAANFEQRAVHWVPISSQTDLRIARMLHSQVLQGRADEAIALYTVLAAQFDGAPDYRRCAFRQWSLAVRALLP